MGKYFVFILITIAGMNAYASWDPKSNDDASCMVEKKNGKRFYFCGKQQDKCAGYKMRKGHDRDMILHGKSFTSKNNSSLKYWCCGGTPTESGHFVKGNSWWATETVETITLESGTCNYKKRVNICGEEESVPCTKPDKCNSGKILRNGECITPCDEDQAYQNPSSNTCVECATTNYQGIDKNNICVKCDKDNEFFNRETKKCISKKEMKQYPHDVMKKCWACSPETFPECVDIFSQPESNRKKDLQKYKRIIGDCNINE